MTQMQCQRTRDAALSLQQQQKEMAPNLAAEGEWRKSFLCTMSHQVHTCVCDVQSMQLPDTRPL